MDRRRFLQTAAVTTLMTTLAKNRAHAETNAIPMRTLGRSGEKVSIVGLGGYHIGMQQDEAESIRIIRTALETASTFSTTAGTTTTGRAKSAWGRRYATATGRKRF